jgi:hypothetical protein
MLAGHTRGRLDSNRRSAATGLCFALVLLAGAVFLAWAAGAALPAGAGGSQASSPTGGGFVTYGISGTNQLIKFSTNAPGTLQSSMPVLGLQSGEILVGIDFRPATGELYGLGIISPSNATRLYKIDIWTAEATQLSPTGAFTLTGTSFGFDFNPVPDRLRIVSDADQDLRINPTDGTLAATDPAMSYAMTDTNSTQNPNVVGIAYTDNRAGTTTTELYDIDSNLDILATQYPPNNSRLNTVGPLGVNTTDQVGFDTIRPTSSINFAFASLTDTQSRLYSINLATGAATLIGTIGDGGIVRDIALAPETPPNTPTPTSPPSATANPSATATTVPPSATPNPSVTATGTSVPPGPTATPTACPIQFQDVPVEYTFYPYVRCLACRGILGGYPCGGEDEPCGDSDDPYFRSSKPISRGQIAKIVSQSAGLNGAPGPRIFEDVPAGSPFFDYIQRLTNEGYMGGYPCGYLNEEPCVGPQNRPYFRPGANATRGQLSKIVANAAEIESTVSGQTYEDVPEDSPFYLYIERLSDLNVMSGYPCGGAGEPCQAGNKPYFRPNADVTRGQAAKIVANTFFPGCQTPARR